MALSFRGRDSLRDAELRPPPLLRGSISRSAANILRAAECFPCSAQSSGGVFRDHRESSSLLAKFQVSAILLTVVEVEIASYKKQKCLIETRRICCCDPFNQFDQIKTSLGRRGETLVACAIATMRR